MIKFFCEFCGESLSVDDMHSGTGTKCPVCRETITIPKVTEIFEFVCANCDGLISCPIASKGNFIHCDNCGEFIEVPSADVSGGVRENNLISEDKYYGASATSETPGQIFEANNSEQQEITVQDTYRLMSYPKTEDKKRPGILTVVWRAIKETFLDYFWFNKYRD